LRAAISSRSRCSYPTHDRKGPAHLRSSTLVLLLQVPSAAFAKWHMAWQEVAVIKISATQSSCNSGPASSSMCRIWTPR
jgi:hypothetical protein